jgi:hypothetical protein
MSFKQSEQMHAVTSGHDGRPTHYPEIEDYPELLFYIQRNMNINAVIYEVNFLSGGMLHLDEPIKISWLHFEDNLNTQPKELNVIQQKLAYGYHHIVIHPELISFRFVSYEQLTFYLAKNEEGRFRVFLKSEEGNIELKNIYIYAEDLGVFPQVKYAELFGKYRSDKKVYYKKLIFE